MLNKEKFAKEIVEIVTNGRDLSVVNGKPCSCDDTCCADCDFHNNTCAEGLKEWANSEYKELVIDWDKVPVDTPVLVWDYDDRCKKKKILCWNKWHKIHVLYWWSNELVF